MVFGYNINLKNTPKEIIDTADKEISTGLFGAIEVTYYEDTQLIDTFRYNKALHEVIDRYHPHVTVHISNFDTSEQNTAIRAAIVHEFCECCKYVKSLGGNEIIMHNGSNGRNLRAPMVGKNGAVDNEKKRELCWDLSVRMMKICCDIAKQDGINVYTENLGESSLTPGTDDLLRFIDDVNKENIGIVYDIGHSHLMNKDIPAEVRRCGHYLKHLHIHDNNGESDQHLPLGKGNIEIEPFIKALNDVDYRGLYMFEIAHATPDKIEKSRNYIIDHC